MVFKRLVGCKKTSWKNEITIMVQYKIFKENLFLYLQEMETLGCETP
jgi:hypothetical protein